MLELHYPVIQFLRPWRIVLLKVAYYAANSARSLPNYANILPEYPNYPPARISKPFVKCLQRLNDHTCIYWLNQKNIVLSWFKLTQTIANYNVESIKPRSKSTCLDSSEFFQHQ